MKQSCEEWLKAQFGDDRETIAAIYAEYVAAMADLRGELAAARADGGQANLDRVLHTIKGTAAMAGDMAISDMAQAARGTADSAALDALDAAILAIS